MSWLNSYENYSRVQELLETSNGMGINTNYTTLTFTSACHHSEQHTANSAEAEAHDRRPGGASRRIHTFTCQHNGF